MRNKRFIVLDGLRVVAAVAVLSRHLQPNIATTMMLPESYLGVDLFFMLSGFVITHAYEQRLLAGLGVWDFMKIRIIRLGPLYWLAAFIGLIESHKILNPSVLNFVFLPGPSNFHPYSLNFPTWSLGCELSANILFAACIGRLRGNRIYIPIVIGFAGIVAAALISGNLKGGAHWSDMWVGYARVMFSFFVGALVYRRYEMADRSFPEIIGLGLPVLLLGLFYVSPARPGLYDLAVVAFGFPIIVWLGAGARVSYRIGQIMSFLGTAVYGVYIIQIPIRVALVSMLAHLHVGPSRGLTVMFCIAVFIAAIFLDRYYDTPARAWLKARTGQAARATSRAGSGVPAPEPVSNATNPLPPQAVG